MGFIVFEERVFKQKKLGYQLEFKIHLEMDEVYFNFGSDRPEMRARAELKASVSINNFVIVEANSGELLEYANGRLFIDADLDSNLIYFTSTLAEKFNDQYELSRKIKVDVFQYEPHPRNLGSNSQIYFFLNQKMINKLIVDFFERNIEIFKTENHVSLLDSCKKFTNIQVYTGSFDSDQYPNFYDYHRSSFEIRFILNDTKTSNYLFLYQQDLREIDVGTVDLDSLLPLKIFWQGGELGRK